MTLEKHDINRGLQRIVESYQKEALPDEAKSKTNLLKESYTIVDLETGERFGNFDSVESAKSKAQRYSQQCSATCAVVSSGVSDDSDLKVICGYKNGRERKVTNEAFSDKVKTNLLKEEWYHFEYASGANPYIAFSKKERDRILRKYKGKVEDLGDNHYLINDDEHVSNYNEALSDEDKKNNAMLQGIAHMGRRKLTPQQKKFLNDNDLYIGSDGSDKGIFGPDLKSFINRKQLSNQEMNQLDYLKKHSQRANDKISRNKEVDGDILRKGEHRRSEYKYAKSAADDSQKRSDRNMDRYINGGDDSFLNRSIDDQMEADKQRKRADSIYAFGTKKFAESLTESVSKKVLQDYLNKYIKGGVKVSYIDSYPHKGYKTFNIALSPEEYNNDGDGYWFDFIPGETSSEDFVDYVTDTLNKFIREVNSSNNKFSESLEEDDYFDFEADLAESVKDVGLKWKGRGLSSSDIVKALDNLSVKFEDETFDDEVD